MKKTLSTLIILSVALSVVFFYSCKKKEPATATAQLDAQTEQFNTDQNNTQSESDQSNNDVNTWVNNNSSLSGGRLEQTFGNPCGFTVDSNLSTKTLTFKFDSTQTSCFLPVRVRSGQVIVQLTSGANWGQQGAVLTFTYINYKILYKATNTFIRFNGTKTLTNVNGNKWLQFLGGLTSLEYKERANNLKVDFSGGASATWNSTRTTDWSYALATNTLTFTCNGDTTLNGYSNVDSWGTNRFGQAFTTNLATPVVSNTTCGLWRFVSGVWINHVGGKDYTLTLGVDSNGSPVSGTCAYGFKVSWVDGTGTSQSLVFSY